MNELKIQLQMRLMLRRVQAVFLLKIKERVKKKTGTLEVSISHSSLDETIRKAQEAGLKVEFDSVVDKGTASTASELEKKQKEVESDYRTQADSIEKATEKYREDQRQNQTNRKKIQDENTAKKEQYQRKLVFLSG